MSQFFSQADQKFQGYTLLGVRSAVLLAERPKKEEGLAKICEKNTMVSENIDYSSLLVVL